MKRYEKYGKEEIMRSFVNPFAKNNREVYEFLMEDIIEEEDLPKVKKVYRWELVDFEEDLEDLFLEWVRLVKEEDSPISFARYLRESVEMPREYIKIPRLEILEGHKCKLPRMDALSSQQIIDTFKSANKECRYCAVGKSLLKKGRGVIKKDIIDYPTPYECVDSNKHCAELIEDYLKEDAYFAPRWSTITDNNDIVAMEVKFNSKGEKEAEEFLSYLEELVEV